VLQSDAVELAYAEARLAFLPTFDADAKEPYLVYSARDIAGDDAWGRIFVFPMRVCIRVPRNLSPLSQNEEHGMTV
jgi:hypothetical protein